MIPAKSLYVELDSTPLILGAFVPAFSRFQHNSLLSVRDIFYSGSRWDGFCSHFPPDFQKHSKPLPEFHSKRTGAHIFHLLSILFSKYRPPFKRDRHAVAHAQLHRLIMCTYVL